MPESDASYLYHYTTAEGLKGIARDNKIRATNIFFMNDSEEFRGGLRLFETRLKELTGTHEIYQQCLRAIRSWILGEGQDSSVESTVQMYACCFSEYKDVLSQWRAYCQQGGFALGFRRSKLEALVEKQDFALEKCLYGDDEKSTKVDGILQAIETKARNSDKQAQSPPRVEPEHRYFEIIDNHIFEIMRTAAILKHDGFREEGEWRLLSTLQRAEKRGDLAFRARGALIVPYKEIDLEDSSCEGTCIWEDARIVAGPSERQQLVSEAVRLLLLHHRPEAGSVVFEPSPIPYRPL